MIKNPHRKKDEDRDHLEGVVRAQNLVSRQCTLGRSETDEKKRKEKK